MKEYTTSFHELQQDRACADRYKHLREALKDRGYNAPITLSEILKHNGVLDVCWMLFDHKGYRPTPWNPKQEEARAFIFEIIERGRKHNASGKKFIEVFRENSFVGWITMRVACKSPYFRRLISRAVKAQAKAAKETV